MMMPKFVMFNESTEGVLLWINPEQVVGIMAGPTPDTSSILTTAGPILVRGTVAKTKIALATGVDVMLPGMPDASTS
jgi:hypothetical protein